MTTLSDDDLKGIGRVAVLAAAMDDVVAWILWRLIDADDNVGSTLTKKWSFSRRAEALGRLAPLRLDTEAATKLAAFLDRAKWAYERRNEVLHSAWVVLEPGATRLTRIRGVPGESGATAEIRSFNAEAMDLLARQMTSILQEGAWLLDQLDKVPEGGE